MRRRSVLGALPVALAGCIEGVPTPRADGDAVNTTTATAATSTENATSATNATTTGNATPDRSTPADAGASVCDDPAVSLTRSGRVLRPGGDGEVETIAFALRNRSDRAVEVLPDAWTVYRRACGSWMTAESGEGSGETRTLRPGESHRWSLAVTTHPTPRDPTTSHVVVDLSTGRYSFKAVARADGERVTCAVRFEVDATA